MILIFTCSLCLLFSEFSNIPLAIPVDRALAVSVAYEPGSLKFNIMSQQSQTGSQSPPPVVAVPEKPYATLLYQSTITNNNQISAILRKHGLKVCSKFSSEHLPLMSEAASPYLGPRKSNIQHGVKITCEPELCSHWGLTSKTTSTSWGLPHFNFILMDTGSSPPSNLCTISKVGKDPPPRKFVISLRWRDPPKRMKDFTISRPGHKRSA